MTFVILSLPSSVSAKEIQDRRVTGEAFFERAVMMQSHSYGRSEVGAETFLVILMLRKENFSIDKCFKLDQSLKACSLLCRLHVLN